MGRKIILTGDDARYIEHRIGNVSDDDREIQMNGKRVQYEERCGTQAPHFPANHNEQLGKQWFDMLIANGFIDRSSKLDCWLYQMGFSTTMPSEVRPIAWLKTVETARLMLTKVHGNLIESKELKVARMNELAALCFTKQGEPLKLAKPRKEYSQDADIIENFVPTVSDL